MSYLLIPLLFYFSVNGERHWKSIHCYTRQEVREWLDVMRNASGKEFQVTYLIFIHYILNQILSCTLTLLKQNISSTNTGAAKI